MEKLHLTVAETIPHIGSKTTLYKLLNEGHLVARKLGSKTLIDAGSLRDYLLSLPNAKMGRP